MDLSKMATADVEALLHLLADMEREKLELLMQARQDAERQGELH